MPGATRKAPESVEAVFLKKRIGPLQHKIYHVVLGWSQSILQERMAAGEPFDAATQFTLPLSEVMALCDYGSDRSSHNLEHFENSATSLMEFQVVYGGFRNLSNGVLPEESAEAPVPGRKRRASRRETTYLQLISMLRFDWDRDELIVEFPTELVRMLLLPSDPSVIDWLSLGKFASTSAIQLYGLVLQYEKEGQTPTKHWTDYSRLLTAGPEPHKTFREFNKLLQRTVRHVQDVDQRLDIGVRFTKKGRFFDRLRFDVSRRAQQQLPLTPPPTDLVEKLCGFGMARPQAEKLCRDYSRHHIEANFAYCLQQKREGAIKRTTGGFLHSAIITNYAKAPVAPGPAEILPAGGEDVRPESIKSAPADAGGGRDAQRGLLRKLPLAVRRGMLEQCVEAISPLERGLLPRDLDPLNANEDVLSDPRVESALLQWWNRRSAVAAE